MRLSSLLNEHHTERVTVQFRMQEPLRSKRLTISKMVRGDLDQMQRWKPFTEPLSLTWNLQWHSRAEMDHWFMRRSEDPGYLMYAVKLHNGQLIGRLSLRHIHPYESSVLGIAFGSDWVGHGYGTEALRLFAPYYFDVLGFRVLLLDVAANNERAIRCYENVGFVHAGGRYQPVEYDEDLSFLEKPEYVEAKRYFQKRQDRYWLLYHDMKLERKDLRLSDEEQ